MNETLDQQPWQLSKQPHEWQDILLAAHQALHQNPQDQEALEAIKDANEALQVYDQAEAETGSERLTQGAAGGATGIVGAGLKALSGLIHLPGAAVKGAVDVVQDPDAVIHNIDDAINALAEKVKGVVSHPVQTLEESTPSEIGSDVANAGMLAAPFAKASSAIGLSSPLAEGVQGPVTATTARVSAAPSVGSVLGRAAAAPFKRVGSTVRNWMEKPEVLNQLNREQTALAAARRAGVEATNETIIPQRAAQAGTRQQILEQTLGRQPTLAQQQAERLKLLEQASSRGGPTAENLDLRNELLRLRLELLKGTSEGAEGSVPTGNVPQTSTLDESGLFTNPQPIPEAGLNAVGKPRGIDVIGPPNLRTMTPADEAFSKLRTGEGPLPDNPNSVQFETHGPGGSPLPPISPSRLLGPSASGADIETYLRNIANVLQKGY